MTIGFTDLARSAAAEGAISPPSLLALRQLGWSDGAIGRDEAEAILALNRSLWRASGEWIDFFVDALCEFVLRESHPPQTCDAGKAQWLVGAIEAGGKPVTMAELELLVRLIERARSVPDSLRSYALQQIEAAVIEGCGPSRVRRTGGVPHITGAECRLARRILFATGGRRAPAVSERAAKTLIRIQHATRPEDNSPEWPLLLADAARAWLGRPLGADETPQRVLARDRQDRFR
ncbi:hypothetical protein V5F89_03310 [Pelagerythrobacter marensis]|uniref:DUF222 domain-containing protein n=1 Tax=Pelagerythrobacter marensis TaxID=543877 RepID=A0ABZ2D4I2_9SPHN